MVCAEHVQFGGKSLYKLLTMIFNNISRTRIVPDQFKKAVIVPIPKSKDKDLLIKDNYRGISLLSVLAKLYEKLLLKWYELHCAPQINELQGACKEDSSSLNTSLILQESISTLHHEGNFVYVY